MRIAILGVWNLISFIISFILVLTIVNPILKSRGFFFLFRLIIGFIAFLIISFIIQFVIDLVLGLFFIAFY